MRKLKKIGNKNMSRADKKEKEEYLLYKRKKSLYHLINCVAELENFFLISNF